MRQPCYPLHHNQPAAQKNFQQSNKTFTRVRDWPRTMISDDTVAAFLLFREISEKFFLEMKNFVVFGLKIKYFVVVVLFVGFMY